jgi:hypothetical protein
VWLLLKEERLEFLTWLESLGLAIWVRESLSLAAYPSILAFHAVGLAFLVGGSAAIDLRLLGYADDIPLAAMKKFFPVIYAGFWVNALTGGLLLIASATAMLTSVVFLIKLAFIVLGVVTVLLIKTRVFGDQEALDSGTVPKIGRTLAIASLTCWVGAIIAGRMTAYVLLLTTTFGGN